MEHLKLLLLIAGIITINIAQSQTDFSEANVISTNAAEAESVYAADLDGDGDKDVLSASWDDNKIAWYENIDGEGTFSEQNIISITAGGTESVYATDLDGDGDKDVLSEGWDKIVWHENTDGEGTFSGENVITANATAVHSVYAADLDGDGDKDVLSAANEWAGIQMVDWYENTDGEGTFSDQNVIATDNAVGACSVYAADLDEDGDKDVLSASHGNNKIAWYENTDGGGTFSDQKIITTNAMDACSVYAADLDGDGDKDVLSASDGDNKIAWYENTDGEGTFSDQNVITTNADYAQSVYAADLDGDGDKDVLSASMDDNKIAWYENTDGGGTFSEQNVITILANNASSVYAADLDGDGDSDVLSASLNDNKIAWYENQLYTPTPVNNLSDSQQVSVFPNPAEGKFNLELQGIHSELDVRIYNATGTLLINNEKQRGIDGTYEKTFDFSMHPDGMYYIKVITGETEFVRELVINR